MKYAHPILLISFLFSGTAIAADPVKNDTPVNTQSVDHGSTSHGHMDHGKTPPAKENATFIKLDVNKDGKLSKEEMAKDPKAVHFPMLDTDNDGTLNPAEFEKSGSM